MRCFEMRCFVVSMVAAGLAGVAIMVFTAAAGAEPIRFDNPAGAGHFDWKDGTDLDYIWLDMLLPASGQPGNQNSTTLGQVTVTGSSFLDGAVNVECGLGPWGDYPTPFDAGDLLPGGAPFMHPAWIYSPDDIPPGTSLTIGVPTYLSVRFDLGPGYQYGWIGVVMDEDYLLDAFAWGYETEVGASIAAGAVPEPGTLALLACGLAGLLCYAWRKRK